MPNYLLKDCPQARHFLQSIGRSGATLSPYILISLSDDEVRAAKARGLEVIDDLSGERV